MASGKTSGMTPEGQGDDSFGAKASSAGNFKCNKRRIADYPNLWSYTRELYQTPGIRETVDFSHIILSATSAGSKPRQLVAALGWCFALLVLAAVELEQALAAHVWIEHFRETAQRPHQMLRLALAGLPRIHSKRQRAGQNPRAAHGYSDTGVNEKHADVNGVAAPAMNAGRHQRAGGLGPLNWRRRAGEIANARDKNHNADEDHEPGCDPVEVGSWNREGQRQQVIQDEA